MPKSVIEFLGQVVINIKRAEIAYANYMMDGKKFIYAKILKNCNEKINELLIENSYMLSQHLIDDCLKLICHFDIWTEKWNNLEKTLKPALEDEFIFENKFTFPKDAAKNIENEFVKMKLHFSKEK
jgi:hypothetical protein